MGVTGIYKIQSKLIPDRIYIGSALDIKQRWRNHLSALRKNRHHSGKLQNHYNKYGESDLVFFIISVCSEIDLLTFEQFYLDSISPYFNILLKAGSPKGMIHSEETKNKISIKLRGILRSSETKTRMSKGHSGKVYSEDSRRRMSKSHKGEKNGRFGVKVSDETKRRMSKNHKSKKLILLNK
jgi:group I intron endonuclease